MWRLRPLANRGSKVQGVQLLVAAGLLLIRSVEAQTTSSGITSSGSYGPSISTGYLAVVFGVAFGLVTVTFVLSWCLRCCFLYRRRGMLDEENGEEARGDAGGGEGQVPPRQPSLPPVVVVNPGLDVSCATLEGESLRKALEQAEAKQSPGGACFFEIDFKEDGGVGDSTHGSTAATAAAADGGMASNTSEAGSAPPGSEAQQQQRQPLQRSGVWHWLPFLPPYWGNRQGAGLQRSRSNTGSTSSSSRGVARIDGTASSASGRVAGEAALGGQSAAVQRLPSEQQGAGPFWHQGQERQQQQPRGPMML